MLSELLRQLGSVAGPKGKKEGFSTELAVVIDTQLPGRAAWSAATLCRGVCLWLWELGKSGGDMPKLSSGRCSSPRTSQSAPRAGSGSYGETRGEAVWFRVSGK